MTKQGLLLLSSVLTIVLALLGLSFISSSHPRDGHSAIAFEILAMSG